MKGGDRRQLAQLARGRIVASNGAAALRTAPSLSSAFPAILSLFVNREPLRLRAVGPCRGTGVYRLWCPKDVAAPVR